MKTLFKIKDVVIKIRYILTGAQKKWALVLFVLSLFGSLFEAIGVSIILPLVQVILSPNEIINNPQYGGLFEFFHINSGVKLIWTLCLAVILIYLVKNAYLTGLSYFRGKYSSKVQKEISVEMLESYMKRGYGYFLDHSAPELSRGIVNSVTSTYTLLFNFFKLMAEVITTIMICIYIIVVDPIMATLVIVVSILCILIVMLLFKRKMQQSGKEIYDYSVLMTKNLYQCLYGVKEVLVMGKQRFFVKEYKSAYEKYQKPVVSQTIAAESPTYIIEGMCVTGLIIIVGVKAMGNGNTGVLIAQLAAFAVAAFRILPSLGRISSYTNQIIVSIPGLNETYGNLKEIRSRKEETRFNNNNLDVDYCDGIRLKNVFFEYDNTNTPILDDLNMYIRKGESIGLIGASGAGKTTLADVLLGLLEPQKGEVLLDDNYNIFDIPSQWAAIIGFVPQSVYLTDDSIRNNIGFGYQEEDIDEKKIWQVLEDAQLKKYVEELPDGLDTIIGERGVKMSGGQRQRLALARALYSNPQILVLDEATAALDNETEEAVMESIDHLQGKLTMIIIAHRLTTVLGCDSVYEVKNGKVCLVSKEELYKETFKQ